MNSAPNLQFTAYQKKIIAITTFIQFTIILDFMVLSPLGTLLIPKLNINTQQFGLVVSAYAFSAGISGILAASFADRFDRKKLLLFFYSGFIFGTLACALSPNYHYLLISRIVTGIFGGVIGSISFAIITDLFPYNQRGKVMGFVQTAFSASQILGLPLGLYLATKYNWHMPFTLIVVVGVLAGICMMKWLKPINEHLKLIDLSQKINPLKNLYSILNNKRHLKAYLGTIFLATGGYMLMPFGSTFSTNNLHIDIADLPLLYGITGVFSIITGPLIGKLADKIGKYKVLFYGSILTAIIVLIYTPLGITPFITVTIINVIMFMGITARIVTSGALISAVPEPQNRGAFMAINSAIQQISGGIAAAIAGKIIYIKPDNSLGNYQILGYVVVVTISCALFFLYRVHKMIEQAT